MWYHRPRKHVAKALAICWLKPADSKCKSFPSTHSLTGLPERGLSGGRALQGLAGVSTRNGNGIVGRLVGGSRSLVLKVRGWRRGRGTGGGEAGLLHLGGGVGSLGGRGLELEVQVALATELGRRLDELGSRGEGAFLNVGEVSVGGRRVAGGHGVLAQGGRLGSKTGGVGSGLAAELREIEIGAGTVSHIHGLEEAALGVVAVEDDAVEHDAEDLDDDLNDDADHGPVLKTAEEGIVHLVAKDLGSSI